MDYNLPGSSVHGIFQARIWGGLPFPSPGDLRDPGTEPRFPALQADALPSEPPGKPGFEPMFLWKESSCLFFFFDCPGSSFLFAGFLSSGFSCCWAQILEHAGLRSCRSQALGHRLSCCGTWASLLCSMWDPLGPGIEPMSLALASGFLTTGLPGNSKPMLLTTKLQPLKCSLRLETHYNPGSSTRAQALKTGWYMGYTPQGS